jgi:hypothetical protein
MKTKSYTTQADETIAVPDELEAIAKTNHQSQRDGVTAKATGRLNPNLSHIRIGWQIRFSVRRLTSQAPWESN